MSETITRKSPVNLNLRQKLALAKCLTDNAEMFAQMRSVDVARYPGVVALLGMEPSVSTISTMRRELGLPRRGSDGARRRKAVVVVARALIDLMEQLSAPVPQDLRDVAAKQAIGGR